MRKEVYEGVKGFLIRNGCRLVGFKFSGYFVWIDDKSCTYTFIEHKTGLTLSEVIDNLSGYSIKLQDSMSELIGRDCKTQYRREYYKGVRRGIEIAINNIKEVR